MKNLTCLHPSCGFLSCVGFPVVSLWVCLVSSRVFLVTLPTDPWHYPAHLLGATLYSLHECSLRRYLSWERIFGLCWIVASSHSLAQPYVRFSSCGIDSRFYAEPSASWPLELRNPGFCVCVCMFATLLANLSHHPSSQPLFSLHLWTQREINSTNTGEIKLLRHAIYNQLFCAYSTILLCIVVYCILGNYVKIMWKNMIFLSFCFLFLL